MSVTPSESAAQRADPEAPPVSVKPVAPSSTSGPSEATLIAGEFAGASLALLVIGIGGYYAVSYAPSANPIPSSTPASTALNLSGLVLLAASPALVGRLVCAIGRSSSAYEGSCGSSIGYAYIGTLVVLPVATLLTLGNRDRPFDWEVGGGPTTSKAGVLVGYIVGAALGATFGWNLSKRPKPEFAWIQPANRAGPPPEEVAPWNDLLAKRLPLDSPHSETIAVSILAFAF
jgi:hypothetical protein